MKSKRDYVARLVVYGVAELKPFRLKQLAEWLRQTANDFKKDQSKYSGKFVARFMDVDKPKKKGE